MKRINVLLVCLLLILLFAIPAMAEERTVVGINSPMTVGLINYEHESANNNSLIIGGLVYLDSSRLNLWVSGGTRFYHGSDQNRSYKGLYGNFTYNEDQQTTLQPVKGGGVDGVFGWEWRFGEKRNSRLFMEIGLTSYYISSTNSDAGYHITPLVGTGFGFNI